MAETVTPTIPGSENWKWLPAEWVDEAQPLPRQNIADFIHRDNSGQWWLKPHKDDADHDTPFYHRQLADGDVIAFDALEIFPDFTLTVSATGFEASHDFEPRANWFRLEGLDDDIFDSLEALVAQGDNGRRLQPDTYVVECWWWSSNETQFRFVVGTDGTGRFVHFAGRM
jgi:hypothetical protein